MPGCVSSKEGGTTGRLNSPNIIVLLKRQSRHKKDRDYSNGSPLDHVTMDHPATAHDLAQSKVVYGRCSLLQFPPQQSTGQDNWRLRWKASSGCLALITLMKSTHFSDLDHPSKLRRLDHSPSRRIVIQRQMRASTQIVLKIRFQNVTERRFVE